MFGNEMKKEGPGNSMPVKILKVNVLISSPILYIRLQNPLFFYFWTCSYC